MIEVKELRKSFGKVVALDGASFSAQDGKITALLGPNGAGKSTCLRILSTIIKPSAGDAIVSGFNVHEDPFEVREQIGVLPHNSGIYSRLNATENIEYYGQLHGIQADELKEKTENLLEQLQMKDFCLRPAEGYSQGQKIKVALARALIHDPLNILLDEPSSGLDIMATRALRDIINGLKDRGKCVLFSSHIMQEVETLCEDIVIIDKGVVKFTGTIDEFRNHSGSQDLEEAFLKITDSAWEDE
jgi:sodium transport system ATP-binding protein